MPPVIEGYPYNIYIPTLNEWAVCAFLVAGGALVYSLVSEWQPIHDPLPEETTELIEVTA